MSVIHAPAERCTQAKMVADEVTTVKEVYWHAVNEPGWWSACLGVLEGHLRNCNPGSPGFLRRFTVDGITYKVGATQAAAIETCLDRPDDDEVRRMEEALLSGEAGGCC
jgi:hypothetical protein